MHLHVICFDQPYPPAYGGAVEMYYKLRELHAAGFKLILHIFLYNNAQQQQETERLAEKTYYYRRKTGIMPNLSLKPYIVESRRSPELLDNLCRDSHPILFEGLHTTFFLSHPRLAGRLKMVRTHNIEHTFYFYLAKNKPLSWRALFFIVEAAKLRIYERVLRHLTEFSPSRKPTPTNSQHAILTVMCACCSASSTIRQMTASQHHRIRSTRNHIYSIMAISQ